MYSCTYAPIPASADHHQFGRYSGQPNSTADYLVDSVEEKVGELSDR